MEPNMLKQQQRLARVSKHQWREALNGLTRHLTKKLNAKLLTGEAARSAGGSPDGMLVGGRTRTGAHCDRELSGNALFHYQGEAIRALYNGEAEWRDDQTLEEALTETADQLMKQQVQDWKRRRRQLGIQTEADVETIGEVAEEEDKRTEQLQMMWDAVEGDKELETFVDTLSRHKKLDGVCDELHISKREADNLRKKVIRRTNKIKEQE